MGNSSYADGLAFFLAPICSSIKHWSYGGSLGLGNGSAPVNSSSLEAFVAVEFDTYQNPDGPPYTGLAYPYAYPYMPHVGININSMISNETVPWNNNISAGWENDAWISYNATSKMLWVNFTGHSGNIIQQGNLSYEVDLRDYLPEYVTVGFSAATGDLFEKHNIISWSFNSTLQLNVSSNDPPANSGGKNSKGNNKGLIAGLSVGLTIPILALAFPFYCLCKKKYKELEGEDFFDSSMDNELESGSGPKRFSYSELALAINNFAEVEKL